jgi:hypothetical protein
MMTNRTTSLVPSRLGARAVRLAALVWLLAGLAGCSGLLDVDNPNSVPIEEISNPAAAKSLANGVHASVGRAWNDGITLMSVASDELRWVGSRDAWNTLDRGSISEPTNEFVDAAFPYLGEARWFADTAIHQLESFRAARTLPDTNDLARVYLYGAIIYTALGNFFEDFPLASSMRKAAPPVGPANMAQTFDSAIAYTTRGIAALQALRPGDRIADLELALTTARAWARYSKAAWGVGAPPLNQLVNDAGAVADAQPAIGMATTLGKPDWVYGFHYGSNTAPFNTEIMVGFTVNERLENRVGDDYIVPDAENSKKVGSVRLADPITGALDPVLSSIIFGTFGEGKFGGLSGKTPHNRYAAVPVLSVRELHLIIAEARLAAADTSGFTTEINALRALNPGLPPYDPSNPAHPTPLALLQHERRVNLFIQGRRLWDQYRFGVRGQWADGSEALTKPGTLLPITITELQSNPCIVSPGSC